MPLNWLRCYEHLTHRLIAYASQDHPYDTPSLQKKITLYLPIQMNEKHLMCDESA